MEVMHGPNWREKIRTQAGGSRAAPGTAQDAPRNGAPYPDGTRLRGKDGKMYVVRNGVPVPE
jgi:hypothetical protein